MYCTIYKNIYEYQSPHKIRVVKCLDRIKNGNSRKEIERLRSVKDEKLQDVIKKNLPSVVFSGLFTARRDDAIVEYSNLIVMDFDHVADVDEFKAKMSKIPFMFAVWVSPRGNGIKCLVKIADGKRHKEHFAALEKEFPEADKSGKNISRVCYESYDPEIYINPNAEVYTQILKEEYRTEVKPTFETDEESYVKLKKWLDNKSESFVSGNRNFYIYKLASACCRFGLDQYSTLDFILRDFSNSDFSQREIKLTVKSAYRSNTMGGASFSKNELVHTHSSKIVEINELNENFEEFSHIIFGESVKKSFIDIYRKGYEKLNGINCPVLDHFFKLKRREITLFSGYGNMGKSTFLQWILLNRAVLYGEKFALYSPESNPAEEFYLEFVEMLAGGSITPENKERLPEDKVLEMYEFVSKHFFYVYPEKVKPSITNLKESFLELIVKHKIDGVIIDPFNQVFHDRGMITREDFYLEETLSELTRFAGDNDIFFLVVAHPTKQVEKDGLDFKSPDMYKISGGAMWANKMHNILIYNRPKSRSDPDNPLFEITTEKIKKKKIVGKGGVIEGFYQLKNRRFIMPFWDSIRKTYDMEKSFDPLKLNLIKAGLFSETKEESQPLPTIQPSEAFSEDSWADELPF